MKRKRSSFLIEDVLDIYYMVCSLVISHPDFPPTESASPEASAVRLYVCFFASALATGIAPLERKGPWRPRCLEEEELRS